jgi:hypothetical protein
MRIIIPHLKEAKPGDEIETPHTERAVNELLPAKIFRQ